MTTLLISLIAFLDRLFGGSLGGAILALSLGLRVALLPLTLRLARRSQRSQALARRLQPEIDAIRSRHANDPQRQYEETMKLYRRHDFSPFDLPVVLGSLVQLPVFGLVYGAVRHALGSSRSFLWIRSLSSPDALLTLLILGVTAASAYWAPAAGAQARAMLVVLQVLVTGLLVWKLAAGLGLYWASSSMIGLLQSLWLRHRRAADAAIA